jgi:hypothetical protein
MNQLVFSAVTDGGEAGCQIICAPAADGITVRSAAIASR